MTKLNKRHSDLVEAAEALDRQHQELQTKYEVLQALRIDAETSTEEYVSYSDERGFNICTKSVGEEEKGFLERIVGQYAVLTLDPKEELVYEGVYEKIEGGMPTGFFSYSQNGIEYFGAIKGQTFDGPMMAIFPDDGQKIITNVENGVVQGLSKFIGEKETRYAPMYESVPSDGDVLITFSHGTKVFAGVRNGEFLLKGVIQTSKGEILEGDFINLPKQGDIFTGAASLYTGELEAKTRLPIGHGVLHTITEGKTFRGTFLNGQLEGKGSYSVDSTGEVFEGTFKRGKVEGKGSHLMPGQFVYEGDFKAGVYHGIGKFTYEGSGAYEGEFEDGKFEGKGKIYTTEGDYLEGKFKDWNPDGELKFKNISGKEYTEKPTGRIPAEAQDPQEILKSMRDPSNANQSKTSCGSCAGKCTSCSGGCNSCGSQNIGQQSSEAQKNSLNKFSRFDSLISNTLRRSLQQHTMAATMPRAPLHYFVRMRKLAFLGGLGLMALHSITSRK